MSTHSSRSWTTESDSPVAESEEEEEEAYDSSDEEDEEEENDDNEHEKLGERRWDDDKKKNAPPPPPPPPPATKKSTTQKADENVASEEGEEGYSRPGGYHRVHLGDELQSEASGRQYRVEKKLGWGHFSTVWLASTTWKEGDRYPTYVALKIQKSAENYAEAAQEEIEKLRRFFVDDDGDGDDTANAKAVRQTRVGRRCMIELLDDFSHHGPNGVHAVMAFEPLGDNLLTLMKRYDYRGLPLEMVRQIAFQIACGLRFLHEHMNIIHTDLKPENILIAGIRDSIAKRRGMCGVLRATRVDSASYGDANDEGRANTTEATSNDETEHLARRIQELEISVLGKDLKRAKKRKVKRRISMLESRRGAGSSTAGENDHDEGECVLRLTYRALGEEKHGDATRESGNHEAHVEGGWKTVVVRRKSHVFAGGTTTTVALEPTAKTSSQFIKGNFCVKMGGDGGASDRTVRRVEWSCDESEILRVERWQVLAILMCPEATVSETFVEWDQDSSARIEFESGMMQLRRGSGNLLDVRAVAACFTKYNKKKKKKKKDGRNDQPEISHVLGEETQSSSSSSSWGVFYLEGREEDERDDETLATWIRVMKGLEMSLGVRFLCEVPWSGGDDALSTRHRPMLALPAESLLLPLAGPHRLARSLFSRFHRQVRRWRAATNTSEMNDVEDWEDEEEDVEEEDDEAVIFSPATDFASMLEARRARREARDPLLISPRNLSRFNRDERFDVVVKIVDFGNACYADDKFTDDIQTRQYRAPEVILRADYDHRADVWSLACVIFELLTGDLLFDPRSSKKHSRDEDHLALVAELLGTLPPVSFLKKRCERAFRFFDYEKVNARGMNARGTQTRRTGPAEKSTSSEERPVFLRRSVKLNRYNPECTFGLEDILRREYRKSGRVAREIAHLLEPMLTWDYERRVAAREVCESEWFKDLREKAEGSECN